MDPIPPTSKRHRAHCPRYHHALITHYNIPQQLNQVQDNKSPTMYRLSHNHRMQRLNHSVEQHKPLHLVHLLVNKTIINCSICVAIPSIPKQHMIHRPTDKLKLPQHNQCLDGRLPHPTRTMTRTSLSPSTGPLNRGQNHSLNRPAEYYLT